MFKSTAIWMYIFYIVITIKFIVKLTQFDGWLEWMSNNNRVIVGVYWGSGKCRAFRMPPTFLDIDRK